MENIVRFMLALILTFVAASAYAAEPVQMWKCEIDDGVTEAEVLAEAEEWLNAARTMKGGEKMEAHLLFPVAVNAIGEADVWFLITAPSFEEWGKFWDNYGGSPAAEVENKNDKVVCPDSALWEKIKIK